MAIYSRHKAMTKYQKGGDVKQGKETKSDLLSVIDNLDNDYGNAWSKYTTGGQDWLDLQATPEESSYVSDVRQSLLDNIISNPSSIPSYQEGGYISGLRGLLGRAQRERKEEVSFRKKRRDIEKKRKGAGFGSGVGKFFSWVFDKGGDKLLQSMGLEPLKLLKDYAIDPLVTGGLTKLGAELGYGDTVKIDTSSPWLKSAKGELRDYQSDIRGGFSDIGKAAGLQQLGQTAFDDISEYLKKPPKTPDVLLDSESADILPDIDYNMEQLPGDEVEKYTDIFIGQDSFDPLSKESFDRSFLTPTQQKASQIARGKGVDYYNKLRGETSFLDSIRSNQISPPIKPDWQQGMSGYQEGGKVENSLLLRIFGNKSNLF